jgi:opacity protein-like surface antigen
MPKGLIARPDAVASVQQCCAETTYPQPRTGWEAASLEVFPHYPHYWTFKSKEAADMFLGRTLFLASSFAVLATAAGAADMTPYHKAPPPEAQPQATGYVELYGGGASTKQAVTACEFGEGCESFSDRLDGWVLGGAGRANYWWAPNASIQLDAQAEGTSYRFSSGNSSGHFSTHSYLVGGHASWRDPQRGLFGIFGAAGDATASFSSGDARHGLIGLEGQSYWGMVTLYGQVGYNSTLGEPSSELDRIHAWFARGTVRVYPTPNLRLEGTVLFASGEFDFVSSGVTPSLEFETWLWRAKAEYKLAASPFSIFAAYEGSRTKLDFSVPSEFALNFRTTDHRVMGGVRLYLGENTLQWNDNRGTTLDIIAPLSAPSFIFLGGGGAG